MQYIKKEKTLIIIHPHFTIPGGAGKVALEIGKRLSNEMQVIMIAQQVLPEYINEYPQIKFENINGPITSSFLFWLLFPFWQLKTFSIINKYNKQGKIRILISVFPSNWIALPYKIFHKNVQCDWFCHEPSAFIHIPKWKNSIQNPIKRILAKALSPFFSIIDKALTNKADHIFVNSLFSKNIISKIYNRDGIVLYPGVNTDKYKPVDFNEKEHYILSVGRISRFKNLDILIKAFAKIKDDSLLLYIIGDGDEKENLVKLTKQLDIENRVKFLSNISDDEVVQFYAKAKLFVMCSKDEPFGIVPIEAMACGTAVIADDSGGPKETVINKKTGLLINCNEENLTMSISNLLSEESSLRKYCSEANNHVLKNFTWDICVSKIKRFYI